MNRDEFRATLATKKDHELLGLCLRDQELPFVFDTRPQSWVNFRKQVAADLHAQEGDLSIVGSGRLGFSLKPRNNLKAFSDKSDIDVVVVNESLFDELWIALLTAAYPRPPITEQLGGWLAERRREVYTGWISPDEMKLDGKIYGAKAKPVNEIRVRWFTALKRASQHPPRRHEDITARLYRTWSHAELYHLNSLAALRQSLADGS